MEEFIMHAEVKTKKRFRLSFSVIMGFMLVLAIVLTACSSSNSNNKTVKGSLKINNSEGLEIAVSDISETAKFYPVTVDGIKMEVVAVEAPDGTIRTAFNTCQVCNGSPKAYFEQSGNTLQCQNCGNKFPMDKIEVEAGGCNPVPIFDDDKTVTDESITVPYDTLKDNSYRFPANWKQ
jgi:uncharacterized membrane protein